MEPKAPRFWQRLPWRLAALGVGASVASVLLAELVIVGLTALTLFATPAVIEDIKAEFRRAAPQAEAFFAHGAPDSAALSQWLRYQRGDTTFYAQSQFDLLRFESGDFLLAIADRSGRVVGSSVEETWPIGAGLGQSLSPQERALLARAWQGRFEVVWSGPHVVGVGPIYRKGDVVAVAFARSVPLRSAPALWRAIAPLLFQTLALIGPIALLVGGAAGAVSARVILLQRRFDQLQERERLARDLHDTIKQQAFATALMVASARRCLDAGESAGAELALDEAAHLAQRMQTDLAALLAERPDDEEEERDLCQRLERLVAQWQGRGALRQVRLSVPATAPRLRPPARTDLARIAAEALANAVKHSQGSEVAIALVREESVWHLTIDDDGVGPSAATPRRGGLGLSSMESRARRLPGGEWHLGARPGGGTRVSVRFREEGG